MPAQEELEVPADAGKNSKIGPNDARLKWLENSYEQRTGRTYPQWTETLKGHGQQTFESRMRFLKEIGLEHSDALGLASKFGSEHPELTLPSTSY